MLGRHCPTNHQTETGGKCPRVSKNASIEKMEKNQKKIG